MTDDYGVGTLTPAELEVLIYKSKGLRGSEIAKLKGVQVGSITKHLTRIYQKLDVSSSEEAAVIAAKMGLV